MMRPEGASTQVREANFPDEIPDGISSAPLVLYRTACQGRCGVFRLLSGAQFESHGAGFRVSASSRALTPLLYEEASLSCPLDLRFVGAGSALSSGGCARRIRSSSRK